MNAEGWYVDPYHRHGARWFSDGHPTGLVRDDEVESQDPPPDEPFDGPLEELVLADETHGEDLLRADEGQPPDQVQAAMDTFGQIGMT